MLRNIITVLSGSVIAQLVAIASLPILSRMYGADEFASYHLYITFLNVFLAVASLRMEVGLLSAFSPTRLKILLQIVPRLCMLTAISVAIACVIFAPKIVMWLPQFSGVIYLFPLAVFVGSMYQMLTSLLVRNRDYRYMAGAKIVQSTSFAGAGILMSLSALSTVGLIFADIVCRVISSMMIVGRTGRKLKVVFKRLGVKRIRLAFNRFRQFPLLVFPDALLSALIGTLVPIALIGLFDLTTAGQYALVDRFILLPVGLIANSMTQVVTGDFSATVRSGSSDLNAKYRKTVVTLSLIVVGPTIIGIIVAPSLVPLVFGEQWELAGQLCSVAMFLVFVRFVVAPMNMILVVCNRAELQLGWNVFRLVLISGVLGWCAWTDSSDPIEVLALYVCATVFSYLVFLILADIATRSSGGSSRIPKGPGPLSGEPGTRHS